MPFHRDFYMTYKIERLRLSPAVTNLQRNLFHLQHVEHIVFTAGTRCENVVLSAKARKFLQLLDNPSLLKDYAVDHKVCQTVQNLSDFLSDFLLVAQNRTL